MKPSGKSQGEEVLIIDIEGRIDDQMAQEVQQVFRECLKGNQNKLIFNMEKVDFVSPLGLRVIKDCIKEARGKGGDIKLYNLQSVVEKIFEYTGFKDFSVFCISETQAVQQVQQSEDAKKSETFQFAGTPLQKKDGEAYKDTHVPGDDDLDPLFMETLDEDLSPPLQEALNTAKMKSGSRVKKSSIHMESFPEGSVYAAKDEAPPAFTAKMETPPPVFTPKIEKTPTFRARESPLQESLSQVMQIEDTILSLSEQLLAIPVSRESFRTESNTDEAEAEAEADKEKYQELPALQVARKKRMTQSLQAILSKYEELPALEEKKAEKKAKENTQEEDSYEGFVEDISTDESAEEDESWVPKPITDMLLPKYKDLVAAQESQTKGPPSTSKRRKKSRKGKRLIQGCSQVKYFKKMYNFSSYPLEIELAKDEILALFKKNRKKIYVKIAPIFYGCIVVPPYDRVDITAEKVPKVYFEVTPLAAGKHLKSFIEVRYHRELLELIEVPTEIEEKTIPRTLAFMGLFLLLITLGSFWQSGANFVAIGLSFFTLFFSAVLYWLKRPIVGYPHLENRVSKDGSISKDDSTSK